MDFTGVICLMFGLLALTATAAFLAPQMRERTLHLNASVGIKTRHTLASDEAWLAAHEHAAPLLSKVAWAGWAFLGTATVFCVLSFWTVAAIVTGIGFAVCVTLLLIAGGQANTVAKGFFV